MAERGRVMRVAVVWLRHDVGSPFHGGREVLVELCGPGQQADNRACWPNGRDHVTQQVAAAVARHLPPARETFWLMQNARDLAPSAGAGQTVWVVGTAPFALAFRDDGAALTDPRFHAPPATIAPDDVDLAHPHSTRRHPRLVNPQGDTNGSANVVLIFPDDFVAGSDGPPVGLQRADVIVLSEPMPLPDVVTAVAVGRVHLKSRACRVSQVPAVQGYGWGSSSWGWKKP
ncbi:MAG TPA: hypothetical protein VK324_09735 [Tepidisphaeraceae bacterium]|nr:hypothetical protein [Tepidisphaeraceae bacterium]